MGKCSQNWVNWFPCDYIALFPYPKRSNLLNHVYKSVMFILLKFFEIFGCRNVKLVLRLRLWWLERACQNSNFGIFQSSWHLRMAHCLVNYNTSNKLGVFHTPTNFPNNFYEFKIHIARFLVGYGKNSVDSYFSQLS